MGPADRSNPKIIINKSIYSFNSDFNQFYVFKIVQKANTTKIEMTNPYFTNHVN